MFFLSLFFSLSHHFGIPFRFDLEWGETTVGYWPPWIRQWYVECYRFCNKFVVRCNGSITRGVLFSGREKIYFAVSIEKSVVCSFVRAFIPIRFISFRSFRLSILLRCRSVVIFARCVYFLNFDTQLKMQFKLMLNGDFTAYKFDTCLCRMFVTIACCRYKKKWCTINMRRICRVNSGIHGIRCCYQVSYLCIMCQQGSNPLKKFPIVRAQIEFHFN